MRLRTLGSESPDRSATPGTERTANGVRPSSQDVALERQARVTIVVQSQTDDTHVDDVTFREIVRDHGPTLRRFVGRLTQGDWQLTEDIVQETLLRLWNRPQILRTSHASIRPWLCTVARNLVVDHWRARRSRPLEVDDFDLANVAMSRDAIDEADWKRDMAQAIGELRPEHQAVIRLLYYCGVQLKEAADELGVPLGTVKSRAFYALRELRVILDGWGLGRSESATADRDLRNPRTRALTE